MKALHWADKVILDVLLKPAPWPSQLLIHVPFIWYLLHICILYLYLTINDKTWMSQTETSAQPASGHSWCGMCAASPCPRTTDAALLHNWIHFLNFSTTKKGLSTCFSSHCSGQSGWNLRLPQSDNYFCNNVNSRNFQKKMDEKVFLNSHRPSKWFLFWHKQLSQTCLALKEVSSFSHWFSEGNCTEPISSPDQKRLKFSWTLSKWLKPQKN